MRHHSVRGPTQDARSVADTRKHASECTASADGADSRKDERGATSPAEPVRHNRWKDVKTATPRSSGWAGHAWQEIGPVQRGLWPAKRLNPSACLEGTCNLSDGLPSFGVGFPGTPSSARTVSRCSTSTEPQVSQAAEQKGHGTAKRHRRVFPDAVIHDPEVGRDEDKGCQGVAGGPVGA